MQLEAGQIWQYQTRTGEENSTVTILKLEERNGSQIAHICVSDVMVQGELKELTHLPFSRKSVEESLTKLVSSNNPLPEYQEGYEQWNFEFNKGQAGVFTDSIKNIVNNISDMIL